MTNQYTKIGNNTSISATAADPMQGVCFDSVGCLSLKYCGGMYDLFSGHAI